MKEWKGRNYSFEFTDPSKPVRTFRSRRPCHFIFEIQSYSELLLSLQKANLKSFETPEFTVGDEKWTMCFYPNGNEARGGKGFVSMYLKRQKKSAGRSKEASVSMKFFILDQTADEYLVIEDLGERQFDVRGKEWGIAQAIEINHFTNSDNGLLVDNTCTFGTEVFITSAEPSYSKMSRVETISKRLFEIQIKLNQQDPIDSNAFTTEFDGETYTWKLRLYREGHSAGTNSHISLYLILVDKDKLSNGRSMLVDFQLSLKNKSYGAYTYDVPALDWYNHAKDSAGSATFIKRDDFFSSSTKYDYNQTADVKVSFNTVFILNDADG